MSIPTELIEGLKARYGEPQRHYHTWVHIEALKRHFDSLKAHWHRPEPVLWALYWHDAIYDPTRPDNEELSAQLLEEEGASHLEAADLALAAEIIRATAKHDVPEGLSDDDRADLALFLDIDLSILGAPEPVFDQYEVNVRREYAFVPEEVFRTGRAKVLKSFADRPAIYFTDEGRSRWDAQARRNLSRSLAQLAG
jgi:predicted metal-dependent HD superfamily phosphohydrolase